MASCSDEITGFDSTVHYDAGYKAAIEDAARVADIESAMHSHNAQFMDDKTLYVRSAVATKLAKKIRELPNG